MKRISLILSLTLLFFSFISNAQNKYYTKTGKISFFAANPAENIEAVSKSVVTLLDISTGDIQFAALMKGFEFKKALMQEHFNDRYVESDKFPQAEFKGQITNNNEINYTKDGSYAAKVKGKLTIHGETKDIETTGTVVVKDGKFTTNAVFNLLLSDYKIKTNDQVVSNSIKITVDCSLDPLKQ